MMLFHIPQLNPRSTSAAAAFAFRLLGRVMLGFWLISRPLSIGSPRAAERERRRSRGSLLPREFAGAGPGLFEARGTGDLSEDRLRVPPPPLGRTDWYPTPERTVPKSVFFAPAM